MERKTQLEQKLRDSARTRDRAARWMTRSCARRLGGQDEINHAMVDTDTYTLKMKYA